MAWNVKTYGDTDRWMKGLSAEERAGVTKAIDLLRRRGPALGRPAADTISGSRHHNMKELRSFGGHQRILFAFDRDRNAVLLVGGNKEGKWKSWYRKNIPKADRLFDQYNRERGGGTRWRAIGAKSAGR